MSAQKNPPTIRKFQFPPGVSDNNRSIVRAQVWTLVPVNAVAGMNCTCSRAGRFATRCSSRIIRETGRCEISLRIHMDIPIRNMSSDLRNVRCEPRRPRNLADDRARPAEWNAPGVQVLSAALGCDDFATQTPLRWRQLKRRLPSYRRPASSKRLFT
jgi:hypothetical protein